MSGLEIAALILVGIWLTILTLVMVLVVRQIGILTVRLSLTGEDFSVDDDGPDLGAAISDEVTNAIPETAVGWACVMLISSTCAPCRMLAVELDGHQFDENIIALLAGPKELADGLGDLLPSSIRVIRDPEASQVAQALHIQSTPFAVTIEDGIVTQKSYLYTPENFFALVNGHKK